MVCHQVAVSTLVAVLSTLALTAAPARAEPGGDATIAASTFTVEPGAIGGESFVACPPGQRVTGGGVGPLDASGAVIRISGPLNETGVTANTQSGDVGRFWFASVQNWALI